MKKIYLSLVLVCILFVARGQDVHYTQFYNSPLTLNPALTGVVNGSYRIGIHYRNQWFSGVNNGFFNSPYQTPSIYFDMPINLKNKDAIGVGAFILYDNAGAGSISTFMAQISASYIKRLGAGGKHQLSAGFQLGFTQTSLKKPTFADQYSGNSVNTQTTGVSLGPNVNNFNFNAGLMYYGMVAKKVGLYAGGTIFNTTTPKYNLSTYAKKDLPIRFNIEAGLDIGIGRRFHIIPSGLFMRQSSADQLNTGVAFGYDINIKSSVVLGVYNRANNLTNGDRQFESAIIYAGFQVQKFKFGASYDFTTSKFKEAGIGTGGLELSLTYIGLKKAFDVKQIMFCPRF